MAETKKASVTTVAEPKEKTVKIKLPRSKEGAKFVSVNERTWLVPRGVEVEVPECVANVLEREEQMEEERFQFIESLSQ